MADNTTKIDAQKLFLLQDLLSSSSSDDDEIIASLNVSKRTILKVQPTVQAGNEFDDEEFRKLFRMKKTTVSILIEDYRTSTFYAHHNAWLRGKPIINAEIHFSIFLCWSFCIIDHLYTAPASTAIVATLLRIKAVFHKTIMSSGIALSKFARFATNKSPIRCVTQLFDVSTSTAFGIIEKVINYLVHVAPKYVKFPRTAEEKEKMSSEFKKMAEFPDVLGCIGQTSIRIVTPSHHMKSTYVNHRDIPTLTLQGISDNKKRFIDVFTCPSGKIRDSGVFELSDIFQELPDICNHTYHILGDSAYPLREWCITRYRGYRKMTKSQKIFNKKFDQTRIVIKDAFDLLKSRFRQLLQLHFHRVEKITKFILACCVLHNLCVLENDTLFEDEFIVEDIQPYQERVESKSKHNLRRLGEMKRDTLATSF